MQNQANKIERAIMAMLESDNLPNGKLYLQIHKNQKATHVKWLKDTALCMASGQVRMVKS